LIIAVSGGLLEHLNAVYSVVALYCIERGWSFFKLQLLDVCKACISHF